MPKKTSPAIGGGDGHHTGRRNEALTPPHVQKCPWRPPSVSQQEQGALATSVARAGQANRNNSEFHHVISRISG